MIAAGGTAMGAPPKGAYSLTPRKESKGTGEVHGQRFPSCGHEFSLQHLVADYSGKVVKIGSSDWIVVDVGEDHFQAERPELSSHERYYIKVIRLRRGYRGILMRWEVDNDGALKCGDSIWLATKFLGTGS